MVCDLRNGVRGQQIYSFSVKLCNPVSSIFDLCILVTLRNAYKGLHYWAWKLVGDWIHFDFATRLLFEQTIPLLLKSQLVSSDEGWGLWKWVNACESPINLKTGSTQFSSLNQISRLLALQICTINTSQIVITFWFDGCHTELKPRSPV